MFLKLHQPAKHARQHYKVRGYPTCPKTIKSIIVSCPRTKINDIDFFPFAHYISLCKYNSTQRTTHIAGLNIIRNAHMGQF